jgi:hypothetical protein
LIKKIRSQGDKEQKRNPPEAQTENRPSLVIYIFNALEREIDRRKRKEEKRQANEKMLAGWTRWLAIATIILGFATVGGLVVSICALNDSRDSVQRQLRAYLFRSYVSLDMSDVADDGAIINQRVEFMDGGQTPAYNVRLVGRTAGLSYPLVGKIEDKNALFTPIKKATHTVIFKEDPIALSVPSEHKVPKSAIDLIKDGTTMRWVFWGEVTWDDAFRQPHWLHFCYLSGGPKMADGYFEYCDQYNEAD